MTQFAVAFTEKLGVGDLGLLGAFSLLCSTGLLAWGSVSFRRVRTSKAIQDRLHYVQAIATATVLLLGVNSWWIIRVAVLAAPVSLLMFGMLLVGVVAEMLRRWAWLREVFFSPRVVWQRVRARVVAVVALRSRPQVEALPDALVRQRRRRMALYLVPLALFVPLASFLSLSPESGIYAVIPPFALGFISTVAVATLPFLVVWVLCQFLSVAPDLGASVRRLGDIVTKGTVVGFLFGAVSLGLLPAIAGPGREQPMFGVSALVTFSVVGAVVGYGVALPVVLGLTTRGVTRQVAITTPILLGACVVAMSNYITPIAVARQLVAAESRNAICPTVRSRAMMGLSRGEIFHCLGQESYYFVPSTAWVVVIVTGVSIFVVWPQVFRSPVVADSTPTTC